MSQQAHTKKPWTIGNHQDSNHWIVNERKRWLFVLQQNGELHLDEQLANTRLVAAAPEMLEVLEALVVDINYYDIRIHAGLMEKIYSAIDKAKNKVTV